MKLRYFTLGMVLIFSGILLEAGYPSITGSFIGPRPSGFGFGLVITLIGVPFLLMSIRMPVVAPSTQESNLYEKEYVIFRSDPRRIKNTAHLVRDFRGDVIYTNASNPERLYGIVKASIPKSKVEELRRYSGELEYVWDIVVKPSDKEPYTLKQSKNVDLNSLGGRLYPNDRLIPRSSKGHILVIPSSYNRTILNLYEESKKELEGISSELEFMQKLTRFISEKVPYKPVESRKVIHLDEALKEGGTCKELAASEQILSQLFGKTTALRKGVMFILDQQGKVKYHGGHAWIEFLYGGEPWIADPTNEGRVFKKSEQSKYNIKLESTENIAERSFD